MDREELDLVVGEAVVGLEGRQAALVDAGHLRLETDQESRRGDVEGALGGLVAPRGERPGRGQLLRRLDLLAAHPAGFRKADQQVDMLHPRFFFNDVLEQEIPRVRIRALSVDGRAPARELRDVLVVLRGPRAELRPRQLPLDPLLGEGVHPAVLGGDGGLEALAERALCLAHLVLLLGKGCRETTIVGTWPGAVKPRLVEQVAGDLAALGALEPGVLAGAACHDFRPPSAR